MWTILNYCLSRLICLAGQINKGWDSQADYSFAALDISLLLQQQDNYLPTALRRRAVLVMKQRRWPAEERQLEQIT